MTSYVGLLNLAWFGISAILVFLSLIFEPNLFKIMYLPTVLESQWSYLVITCASLLAILRSLYQEFHFQTTLRSHFLGTVFAIGIYGAAFWTETYSIVGWYLCILAMFHFTEFISIAFCNPKSVSVSSFILNHSREYWIAMAASWLEFGVESYLFPGLKEWRIISWFGLALCVAGEILRKTAMFTAASNFNHLVQLEKDENHRLLTHGIYSFSRHPSYLGWFLWSIGTQLLLLNPFCTVAYTLVSWNFFRERIIMEEMYLLSFFKEDYIKYQRKVGTGLPFIYGLTEDYGYRY